MVDKAQILTATEYMASTPETNQPMELIYGEVVTMPTPKDIHQAISMLLSLMLMQVVKSNDLGQLRAAPSDVIFSDEVVLQPDLYFVPHDSQQCYLGEDGYFHGTPHLTVEIVSPSSVKHDRVTKFELYEQFGVQEYWIVAPEGRFIEVYVLQDNKFVRQGAYDTDSVFTSHAIEGLVVNVGAAFPPILDNSQASDGKSE